MGRVTGSAGKIGVSTGCSTGAGFHHREEPQQPTHSHGACIAPRTSIRAVVFSARTPPKSAVHHCSGRRISGAAVSEGQSPRLALQGVARKQDLLAPPRRGMFPRQVLTMLVSHSSHTTASNHVSRSEIR